MRLVIVEDEIRIREGIEKLISKMNLSVEVIGTAEDGEEGLKLCLEKRPDIIITDIKMPRMDGLEMLTLLAAKGLSINAIVISAYSEFEYAKKAMSLGVTDYILKPVSVPDFQKAIQNCILRIEEKKLIKPAQIGTLEQLFRDAINQQFLPEDATINYLNNNYSIDCNKNFFAVCAYIGNDYDNAFSKIKKQLTSEFSFYKKASYTVLESNFYKSIIVIIYNYEDGHDIERWVQYQILQQNNDELVFGCVESDSLNEIGGEIAKLYSYMDWSITFDKSILISYPKITNVHTDVCIYPVEIETRCKQAICANEFEKIKRYFDKFHKALFDGKVHNPKEIKDCYVRFAWKVIEIAKDVSFIEIQDVNYQDLMNRLMNAKSQSEIRAVCDGLIDDISSASPEEITDLTVLRAKSIINEFYSTGITLEEIAFKLNITPEYLGTKFHKETGSTFKNYLKNIRMNKAKELLAGTSLKLYEISDSRLYRLEVLQQSL